MVCEGQYPAVPPCQRATLFRAGRAARLSDHWFHGCGFMAAPPAVLACATPVQIMLNRNSFCRVEYICRRKRHLSRPTFSPPSCPAKFSSLVKKSAVSNSQEK